MAVVLDPLGGAIERLIRKKYAFELDLNKTSGGYKGMAWATVKLDLASRSNGAFSKSWLDKVLRGEPGKRPAELLALAALLNASIFEIVEESSWRGQAAISSNKEAGLVSSCFEDGDSILCVFMGLPGFGQAEVFEEFMSSVGSERNLTKWNFAEAGMDALNQYLVSLGGKAPKNLLLAEFLSGPVGQSASEMAPRIVFLDLLGLPPEREMAILRELSAPLRCLEMELLALRMKASSVRRKSQFRKAILMINATFCGKELASQFNAMAFHFNELKLREAVTLPPEPAGSDAAAAVPVPSGLIPFLLVESPMLVATSKRELRPLLIEFNGARKALGGVNSAMYKRLFKFCSPAEKALFLLFGQMVAPLDEKFIYAVASNLISRLEHESSGSQSASLTVPNVQHSLSRALLGFERAGWIERQAGKLSPSLVLQPVISGVDSGGVPLRKIVATVVIEGLAPRFTRHGPPLGNSDELKQFVYSLTVNSQWNRAYHAIRHVDSFRSLPHRNPSYILSIIHPFFLYDCEGARLRPECCTALGEDMQQVLKNLAAVAWMGINGYSDPRAEQIRGLAVRAGWRGYMPNLPFGIAFRLFSRSWRYLLFSGRLGLAYECAQALSQPHRGDDPLLAPLRELPLGVTCFWMGQYQKALTYCSKILASPRASELRGSHYFINDLNDPICSASSYVGLVWWQMGNDVVAESYLDDSVEEMQKLNKPFGLGVTLYFRVTFEVLRILDGSKSDKNVLQALLDSLFLIGDRNRLRLWRMAHDLFTAWLAGDPIGFRYQFALWKNTASISTSLWYLLELDLQARRHDWHGVLSTSQEALLWTSSSGERWLDGRLHKYQADAFCTLYPNQKSDLKALLNAALSSVETLQLVRDKHALSRLLERSFLNR